MNSLMNSLVKCELSNFQIFKTKKKIQNIFQMSTVLPLTTIETNTDLVQPPRKKRSG